MHWYKRQVNHVLTDVYSNWWLKMDIVRDIIQCILGKKETHKSSLQIFRQYYNDLIPKKSITLLQNSVSAKFLLITIWWQDVVGHACSCISTITMFKWWCQNCTFAHWTQEVKGLTGSATFQIKGMCWKDMSCSISFVLFCQRFFCLDSLFWHGLARSDTWSYQRQHHYSAHNRFWHANKLQIVP